MKREYVRNQMVPDAEISILKRRAHKEEMG
jgi:hypothetical protein